MKKKMLITFGTVVIISIVGFIGITNGLTEGKAVELSGVDLSTLPDGDYIGTYNHKRWTNTLIVHVNSNEITSIEIVQDVAAAGITDCADETFKRVMDAQDTKIDAVSGATVTSKAYLMSIENALTK